MASSINLNTILCTEGLANQAHAMFLLDSGAAVSVVRLRSLSVEDQQAVTKTKSAAVNANGTPINVKGQIKLVVSIGFFTCEHEFNLLWIVFLVLTF